MLDHENPHFWHLKVLRAIAGLQAGDKQPAIDYLAFVELHRGREVAMEAKAGLQRLARGRAFADAAAQLHKAEHPNTPKTASKNDERKSARKRIFNSPPLVGHAVRPTPQDG